MWVTEGIRDVGGRWTGDVGGKFRMYCIRTMYYIRKQRLVVMIKNEWAGA